jgi:uncharacterized protein
MRGRVSAAVVVATAAVSIAAAASLEVRGPQDGGFITHVRSLKEARFVRTLRQRYDFSCGSAAVATLLTHHYGQTVAEGEVFTRMFEHGDRAKIRKEGFSMLDMKRYLATRGLEADGFDLPITRLAAERMPAIVLLAERGYRHFVVVKGVAPDRVLIGDPAVGTRAMTLAQFHQLWANRILFVVRNQREHARFNLAGDWQVAPPAPLFLSQDRERMLESLPVRRAGSQ